MVPNDVGVNKPLANRIGVPSTYELPPSAREHLGDTNPIFLKMLRHQALCYQRIGKFDTAIAQFDEAFEKSREQLGLDDPDTLDSMNSLASH